MKHSGAILLLLSATAQALPQRYMTEIQAPTRNPPTLATEGMSLDGPSGYPIRSFTLAICAQEGETLAGGGTLRAWVYHPRAARWMRNAELDKLVTLTGEECQTYNDFAPLYLGAGRRVLFATEGVGATVFILIDGVTAL